MGAFGKYQLVERLGRGGMGEVWKAKIAGPGGFERTVVVKRILPYLLQDRRFVKMFFAEARLSALLHHPNIVQVYQLDEVDGEWVLTMEYVHGRDLSTALALREREPQPPGFGAFVLREVCRALAYAHTLTGEDGRSLRLIHRDISPSNIMLGYEGAVKVLDFGLAKALDEAASGNTRTGALKGKLPYLSPEQVGGVAPDHRADQFAVGVVLYETLTGRRLFTGAPAEILASVSAAVADPPSRHNSAVPPELDHICLRALERDREARYPSCEEMGRELEEVVHELRWSSERLAGHLKELAPPSLTTMEVLARLSPAPDDDDDPPSMMPTQSEKPRRDTVPAEIALMEPEPGSLEPSVPHGLPRPITLLPRTAPFPPPQVPPPRRRGWAIGLVATAVAAALGWWIYATHPAAAPAPPPVAADPYQK